MGELMSIKDRMPDKNGRYLVLIQEPLPSSSYVGDMPWKTAIQVVDYIIEPRFLAERNKVPYWAYPTGEKDYTFFITHWAEPPHLPNDYQNHRPDKEKAIEEYYKVLSRSV